MGESGSYTNLRREKADLNSHGPTLQRYRRMLEKWDPLQSKQKLTKDDILSVVNITLD
jgi:uncharacterized protein YfbU (UPF0304 family)